MICQTREARVKESAAVKNTVVIDYSIVSSMCNMTLICLGYRIV